MKKFVSHQRSNESPLIRRGTAWLACGMMLAALLAAATPTLAQGDNDGPLPEATVDDGERYPITGIDFFYTQPNLPLPAMSNLLETPITLGQTEGGLVAYREGLPKVRVRLSRLTQLSTMPDTFFYASAIRQISQALLTELNERGYEGFIVAPVPGQFNAAGEDLRKEGELTLDIAVRPVRNAEAQAAMEGEQPDGMRYTVSHVVLRYTEQADWLPDLKSLYDIPIRLSETEGGFVAPREGLDTLRLSLRELGQRRDTFFYRSALQQVMETILTRLNERGYAGFVVQPAPGQINEQGEDVRLSGDTMLTIDIETTGVRSAADSVTGVDGMRYPVSGIRIQYAMDRKSMPTQAELLETSVTLGDTEDGFTSYRQGMVQRTVTLGQIPVTDGEDHLFGSAIKTIATELVEQFNQRGYVGVVVQPAEGQFSDSGLDIRPAGDNTVTFTVQPGVVTAVNTTASGEDDQTRENAPEHQAIRQGSPVQPTDPEDPDDAPRDVMRQAEIERYVHWLNRHPGRRVDVAVAAGEQPGSYELDFLVHQQKPWRAFVQGSNTGTDQTDDWRQRFGFVHNQLTGADDILRLDYITAAFDEMHTFVGSYERPFPGAPRLRARVFGSYSEFTASDINVFDENITGDSYSFGGELAWNVFQHEDFFVDAVGGVRYLNASITNELFDATGETGFFLPSAGLRAQRVRQTDTFHASIQYETNLEDVDTDEAELANFGRSAIDADFSRITFDVGGSFYLQPMFDRSISRARPPVEAMVHEIALSARGQYVLDDKRIIPQLQHTAGGLHTVRGYEEAVSVGDNAVVATAEYRFHLPRLLSPGQPATLLGREFAYRPANELARPGWDLILKAFVDAGSVNVNERLPFEVNEDLVGAGVGVEVQLWRNLNLQLDWATALKSVQGDGAGDNRFHFVGTFLY